MFSGVVHTSGFDSDLKHLRKRYQSLDQDLDVLVKALYVWLCLRHGAGQSLGKIYVVLGGYGSNGCCLYKVRYMACASIPGKGSWTGLRVIFAYWPESDTLEFIQIYLKADSKREDQARIRKYLKTVRQ